MIIELEEEYKKIKVIKSVDAYEIFRWALLRHDLFDQEKENCYVLCLRRSNTIRFLDLVSIGSLSGTIVHAREVFRRAVANGAATVIVGHNHPSGSLTPSQNDDQVTRVLKQAGDILDIRLTDHIIFTGEGYFSYSDQGLLH